MAREVLQTLETRAEVYFRNRDIISTFKSAGRIGASSLVLFTPENNGVLAQETETCDDLNRQMLDMLYAEAGVSDTPDMITTILTAKNKQLKEERVFNLGEDAFITEVTKAQGSRDYSFRVLVSRINNT